MNKYIFYLTIFVASLAIATNKTEVNRAQIIAKQEKNIKEAYLKHKNMINKKTPSLSTSKQLASGLPEPKDFANQKLVARFKTILPNSQHARLATKEIHTLVNKNGLKSESELQEHKELLHKKALKTIYEVQTLHTKVQKKSKFYKKAVMPTKPKAILKKQKKLLTTKAIKKHVTAPIEHVSPTDKTSKPIEKSTPKAKETTNKEIEKIKTKNNGEKDVEK